MSIDKLSRDPKSLFVALNLQQDALEAISLKAKHRDVLWQACAAALQVCRNTPQRVLDALQTGKAPPE
ncbi:MAG: hypothetical protein CBARDMAM_4058 [uncultured Caballeronia sp.]|nr:MAG: hypothetical protein CBARDMAM_4058 [uncultured Caballeronia sp.]